MSGVTASYPKDIDAKAFHALALLSAILPGDTTRENAKKAVALMYPSFREHPNHPGLAHYVIHACDHPLMAKQGLKRRAGTLRLRRPRHTRCRCRLTSLRGSGCGRTTSAPISPRRLPRKSRRARTSVQRIVCTRWSSSSTRTSRAVGSTRPAPSRMRHERSEARRRVRGLLRLRRVPVSPVARD